MEIDRLAREIYPGIVLIADEALEKMCGFSYIKGSLVPNYSDEYEKAKQCGDLWEKLLRAYPELEKISSDAVEELKRRLFFNHHILLAESVASSSWNLRYSLEHEYFEKLCETEAGVKELLAQAYEVLFSDEEAPLLIMDLFSGSHYTRFPPVIEFWSQWFRPSFDNYKDLGILSKLKARARGLKDDVIQEAIRTTEDRIGCRAVTAASAVLASIKPLWPNDDLPRLFEPEKILIVDDEIRLCEMLKEIIEDETRGRCRVDYAINAADALNLIRGKNYGLIFLDIKLNGGSGIDILKQFRDLSERPKIVIHSALSSDSQLPVLAQEGVADCVTDYLDKSHDLSIPEFLHYLERILA